MNIGQLVKIKEFDKMPADLRGPKLESMAGFKAEIIDRLYSEAAGGYVYALRLTGAKTVPSMMFPESVLESIGEDPATYYHEIRYLDDVVLVILYEAKNGKETEIARGHGHIIHEGAKGVAQAASYAMKRCYEALLGK